MAAPRIKLLNQSLQWAEMQLGHAAPAGFGWAEASLKKLGFEHQQVRAHLPEMLTAFERQAGAQPQIGEIVLAEGGRTTYHRAAGVPLKEDNAIAVAIPFVSEGERFNHLVLHHGRYAAAPQSVYGNTLGHELGHLSDVEHGVSDMIRPRFGHHSGSLFKLAHDLDAALIPTSHAAKVAPHLVGYAPEMILPEKFALATGHYAAGKLNSPLCHHYLKTIFCRDLECKALGLGEARNAMWSARMAAYPKVVGEGLEPVFDHWREATQALERVRAAHAPQSPQVTAAVAKHEASLKGLHAHGDAIRKQVGAFMDQAVQDSQTAEKMLLMRDPSRGRT